MNIFCILGKTGSGKTTYMNRIINDTEFMKEAKLSLLVYGTTRRIRQYEVEGVDYHYYTQQEYENIPKEDLIETRTYNTINDGEVSYFTKREYFENSDRNIICVASPYQYEYYKDWCNKENIKNPGKYNIFCIYIELDTDVRIRRSLYRANTENDIYEICRRVLEEREEFCNVIEQDPEFLKKNTIIVFNGGTLDMMENEYKIKGFIIDALKSPVTSI